MTTSIGSGQFHENYNGWITTKDRMPPCDTRILVYHPDLINRPSIATLIITTGDARLVAV